MRWALAVLLLLLCASVSAAAPASAPYSFGLPGEPCSGRGLVGGQAIVCFSLPAAASTLALVIVDGRPDPLEIRSIAARVEFPGTSALPEDICDAATLPVPSGAMQVRVAVQSGPRSGFCEVDISLATTGRVEVSFS